MALKNRVKKHDAGCKNHPLFGIKGETICMVYREVRFLEEGLIRWLVTNLDKKEDKSVPKKHSKAEKRHFD